MTRHVNFGIVLMAVSICPFASKLSESVFTKAINGNKLGTRAFVTDLRPRLLDARGMQIHVRLAVWRRFLKTHTK